MFLEHVLGLGAGALEGHVSHFTTCAIDVMSFMTALNLPRCCFTSSVHVMCNALFHLTLHDLWGWGGGVYYPKP